MSQGENLSRKDNEPCGGGRKIFERIVQYRRSDTGRRKDASQGRVKRGGKEILSQRRVGGGD